MRALRAIRGSAQRAFRDRRALLLAIAAAWILVVARSAVFIVYQQSLFDSDQAIVGLMAKHLLEGRAFPLFFYGQTFLLGVEAWVAAIFFLALGPTVAALHTAQMAWSLAASALLIVCLVHGVGLRPSQALAASLFFTFAPPVTAALLIEANGCNIEPFLYVVSLWMLRDRPLWFGTLLAVGFLNREFTVYAVPALAAVQLAGGTFFRSARLRAWLLAAVAFVAVTQVVEHLEPYADLKGPGTRGQAVRGSSASIVDTVRDRMAVVATDLPGRARMMAVDYFPRQIGMLRADSNTAPQGRDWLFWPMAAVLLLAGARALTLAWRTQAPVERTGFGWYLAGVGVCSAIGYILARPVEYGLIDRYMLLTLYGPIGIVGLFLALEPRVWLRRGAVAMLVVWSAVSGVDHARLFARYWGGAEPDQVQRLADELVNRGIHVAAAGYWRAYRATFLSGERVKIASTDVNRIDEYQKLADQQGPRLVVIRDQPCATDLAPIHYWYLCREGAK